MMFGDTASYLEQVYQDMIDGEWHTDCECYDFVPMKMTQRNGIVRVVLVCTICAKKKTNGVKKSDYPNVENFQEYKDCAWVSDIQNDIQSVKDDALAKRQENFAQRNDVFWEAYQKYLLSDKWKNKSYAVCKRDAICQACNSAEAQQAHHLTYRHVFNEPLFDLIGVCVNCHDKITNMDRERRGKTSSQIAELYLLGGLQ